MQARGVIGRAVAGMIRRTVRARFHTVYWVPPSEPLPESPLILAANHHSWHDGYLMFHLFERLGLRFVDWIAEYDAFPLFRTVGGLPFPPDDPARRAATLKGTIRLMRAERMNLMLFPEGTLHEGPEVWPLGKAIELVQRKVPDATVVPVAIAIRMGIHERPTATIAVGEPMRRSRDGTSRAVISSEDVREAMAQLLAQTQLNCVPGERQVLVRGTADVNERWDVRRWRGWKS